jgi:hypothetical protein
VKALVFALLLVGCAKKSEDPPATIVQIPADEVKRGQDACQTYVDKVCACTSDAAKQACPLAKALPEAIQVSLDIAGGTQKPDESRSAITEVRKIVKGCIESLAKLPSLGCN